MGLLSDVVGLGAFTGTVWLLWRGAPLRSSRIKSFPVQVVCLGSSSVYPFVHVTNGSMRLSHQKCCPGAPQMRFLLSFSRVKDGVFGCSFFSRGGYFQRSKKGKRET